VPDFKSPSDSGADPIEDRIARLATFPEQNPNIVIETELDGHVTYLNPVAAARFPGLFELGSRHPLLAGLAEVVGGFLRGEGEQVAREVDLGDAVFEQNVCYTQAGNEAFIRIYAHDITALRRAEQDVHDLARRVVLAQEEERRRVSRELHDDAGQALIALKISLELLVSEADSESMRSNLSEAIDLVDQTRERIRLLAQGLRPPVLDALGLDATLQELCADFSKRTGLEVRYDGSPIPDLSDDAEICLYRVAQEALTNAAVHAAATKVQVTLQAASGRITLTVEDDGRGIEMADVGDAFGSGLLGMRERLDSLLGQLEIEAIPHSGTRLTAALSLDQ